MREILNNMALILVNEFCRKHGIDCSNSYVTKAERGFTYRLADGTTGADRGVWITFHKSSVPTFRVSC